MTKACAPEVAGRIRAHLLDAFPNGAVELTGSTDLLSDYFFDSIAVIEVVDYLEREFAIRIRRADVNGDTFRCIDAIARFVVGRMSE
jgi:acyl carrier protein